MKKDIQSLRELRKKQSERLSKTRISSEKDIFKENLELINDVIGEKVTQERNDLVENIGGAIKEDNLQKIKIIASELFQKLEETGISLTKEAKKAIINKLLNDKELLGDLNKKDTTTLGKFQIDHS